VRVVETPIGGKIHALNLGDRYARAFPRLYVDADVVIKPSAVQALVDRLAEGDVLAVAPRPTMELDGCPWSVRTYYDIAARLPALRQGFGGSGVYALSQRGRERFGEFPLVTNDDGFVRVQFQPHERATVAAARTTVFPPRSLRNLIAIKARAQYGNWELARLMPDLWKNKGEGNVGSLVALCARPALWHKLATYALITVLAKSQARQRQRTNTFEWTRDDTSRV
jgi:hypothetical protein